MPVKSRKTDVIVCDFHHAKDRICAILNINSYSVMLPHYQALVKFLGKYKDDNFYAIFTDEEQAKIEAGEKEVSGLCIYTLAYVKLFAKGRKKARYKHIYKIMRTNRSNYEYYIQRKNVKTNRLKYLYRRVNERYESINNA
jgi:glutathione peroxidase-family protein